MGESREFAAARLEVDMVEVEHQSAGAAVVGGSAGDVEVHSAGLDVEPLHVEAVEGGRGVHAQIDALVELCQFGLKGLEVGRRDIVVLEVQLERRHFYLVDGVLER